MIKILTREKIAKTTSKPFPTNFHEWPIFNLNEKFQTFIISKYIDRRCV